MYKVYLCKNYANCRALKKIYVTGAQPIKNWLNQFYKGWQVINLTEVKKC